MSMKTSLFVSMSYPVVMERRRHQVECRTAASDGTWPQLINGCQQLRAITSF